MEPRELMAGQRGIWYAQQLDPENTIFNAGEYGEILGQIDVVAFVTALRQAIDEAQALHARFVSHDGGVWQDLSRRADWKLHRIDVTEEKDPRGAAEHWMWADMRRPVDLAAGPLFTQALFTAGPDRYFWYARCHHIAVDGFSSPIVFARTVALYNAARTGAAPEIGPLAPVETLIDNERAYRNSPAFDDDRRYWAARFPSGVSPVSWSDVSAPGKPRWFRRHREPVAPERAKQLRAAARRLRTTLSVTMIAATAAYTHRLTGAGEIVLGVPVLGRSGSAELGVPAMKANILPIRIEVRPQMTTAELVREVSGTVRQALRHQRYRYEDISRDLRLSGGSRLFGPSVNVMAFDVDLRLGDAAIVARNLSNGPVDDLTVSVYDRGGDAGFEITFDANPQMYTDEETTAHAQRFMAMLDGIVSADPGTAVRELDLFGPGERHRVLVAWNDTATPAEAGTVPELFQTQVRQTPDAVAVSQHGTTLTYAGLDRRTDRLARHLTGCGAGPERPVAVLASRTPDLVVALLAALKAGAPYVPLDPAHPAARIAATIGRAAPAVLLTDHEPAPDVAAALAGARVVRLDEPLDDPTPGELRVGDPDNAAYITFTSGSTGRPKGVVVTHRNLVNLLTASRSFAPLGASDRLVAVTTVAFDIANLELLAPLVSGAQVVLADAGTVRDPHLLAELLTSSAATVLQATPAAWQALAATAPQVLPGLRKLVGGEALPAVLAETLRDLGGEVVNLYGPTETTIWSTAAPLDKEQAGTPSIGRPIDNTAAYVLDAALNPVPPGVVGELYLAGAGLARGYHREPGLTASRFVANPFGPPGSRLYRTGDTARWNTGGTLHFTGRTDHQIKLRGFRIEPAEIENVLLRHPGVRQVVVVAHDNTTLVAYVTTRAGETAEPGDLIAHAAGYLPHYMVPATVVLLDELPMTANRKVDRLALPAPRLAGVSGRAPRDEHERALCALFAETLALPAVGLDDDFFALGGHSLLATQLDNRIQAALGTRAGIRAIFDHPTPAGLSAYLRKVRDREVAPEMSPRPARIPLSPAQYRMWFLDQLDGPSATQHIAFALRLTGTLDDAALLEALAGIVGRHEVLRTVLPVTGGEPEQRILDAAPVMTVVTVAESGLPGVLSAVADQPFDLATQTPLRVALFRIAPRTHVLLVVLHHIAGDGWSLHNLAGELAAGYAARVDGRSPHLPDLPIQYADHARWQQAGIDADRLAFWRDALHGLPELLSLPVDRPRAARTSYRGDAVPFTLTAAEHRRLHSLAREHQVSLFMVFQAGLAVLLGRLAGTDDVAIGTPVAGRGDARLEPLIGLFVNTLVLRTDLSGNPTLSELLSRVRATSLAAYAHQDVPFERLVEELAPQRSLSRHPLFQVMLVVDNERPRLELTGLAVEDVPVAGRPTRFDLTVTLTEHDDGVSGAFHFAADLFDRATIEAFTGMFTRILAAGPQTRVQDISLGAPPVVEPTSVGDVLPELLPVLFERQVRGTPGNTALVSETGELTYEQLNARANRLARLLVAHGAGPERIVALAVPRSAETIVALLAVAKTGAAYLPIDTGYPAARIAAMLGAAEPVCVVGTAAAGTYPVVAPDDARAGRYPDHDVSDADRIAPLLPEHPAYVIFTSGSTGRPKGVQVTHTGISNLVATQIERLDVDASSRILQSASLSFDAASGEIFRALLSGAALVLPPPGANPADGPARSIREYGVTHALVPPAVLATLPAGALDGLRTLSVGGEASPPALARPWAQGRRMVNGYGPAEATIAASYYQVRPEDAGSPQPALPIGTAVRGARLYVLDRWLRPLPAGAAGELYIAGPGLARGYLRQPGLTAERFVACPFGQPGERMYRTGDLVRINASGDLEFLGRVDEQVQLRGIRVEPGEIEAVLMRHPSVQRAAVVVHDGHRLVAYVVGEVSEASVREFASTELPDYLVPGEVVRLDHLPLTPNGKLDRRALAAPSPAHTRAARTLHEQVLCGLYAEILGVDEVGADDSFFALGGHSLTAVRLVARIREVLRVDVSVRALFEAPRVADLAVRLGTSPAGEAVQVVLPLNPAPHGRPLFCVHPAGGLAWGYARLLAHLPADLPVYGLQARGLGTDEPIPSSVEQIAEDYADQIRAVQPDGPYRLLGWSFGGILAQAVAVRLQRLGAEVELLALIDTHPRVRSAAEAAPVTDLAGVLGIPAGATTPAELLARLRALDHPLRDLPDRAFIAMYQDCLTARIVRLTHTPQTFHGDVLTFTATRDAPEQPHDWSTSVTGRVADTPIDCGHHEILTGAYLATVMGVVRADLEQLA
ncbi:nonribosomal peptide synthetase DhbF [Actinoplanes lutulentus]|uniref:Nonribosomal peptide synthetase DhbF n=1 Tax=Actinoplanes lutulentus TaxID=1287878 RepID=A0A327ZJT6_9ACTN|nr:non-ribosomal peptide synthetase [Actinoplanes lutulentus]MBB2940598.1 nonribosomal peptide synthetase DhbF [Actinoplanes lutulentus]RAK42909.1 nonribosomal peptide synthetase DhbF [Actinoplanes lutulentus]